VNEPATPCEWPARVALDKVEEPHKGARGSQELLDPLRSTTL
jgi:hypothetical protein